jgi:hypothetical protein
MKDIRRLRSVRFSEPGDNSLPPASLQNSDIVVLMSLGAVGNGGEAKAVLEYDGEI